MSTIFRQVEAETSAVVDYVCSFIPEYVLEEIAKSSSTKLDAICRSSTDSTINVARECHERRGCESKSRYLTSLQEAIDQAQRLFGMSQDSGATIRNIHDCLQTDSLPGRPVRSEGQDRTEDRSINNCYDGFGIVSKFFKEVLNRDSLDGEGMTLVASCHYREKGLPLNNAFWTSARKQVIFGDGDGIVFDYLTDSLDIVAHELTHGLIDHTAKLEYFNQSGALNESCADVFACMIEQWHQGVTVNEADWLLGQTMFPVAFRGVALRSMKNPGSAYKEHEVLKDDIQPKHMDHLYTGDRDRQGVHINSGIPNHAFYLAATEIGGNSWQKIGQVWYHTLLQPRDKIPVNCTFLQFAELTIEVAEKIFEDDLLVRKAIRNAWAAVGVLK